MAQSLSKIYLHIVFHVKTVSPKIREEHWERLHAYIGQLVNSTGCNVIRVGGVGDHVHVLCTLSRNESVAHLVEEIKRNSSRWLKSVSPSYATFSWQGGYAAFSVSQSVLEDTLAYIKNQKEHHQKRSSRDEYLSFLRHYHIDYDEQYVLSD